jgi:WxL domain surface cell wall-binding
MTRLRMGLQGAIAIAVAGTVLGSLSASASAETANSNTQFSVTAGTLAFLTAPTLPELAAVTLNGEAQTTHSTVAMANFKVKDATGTGNGWHVSIGSRATSGTTVSAVFKQYCENASNCTSSEAHKYASASPKELAAGSLTLSSTGATFTPSSEAPTYAAECGGSGPCVVDTGAEGTTHKVVTAAVNKGMGRYEMGGWATTSLTLTTPATLFALNEHEVYRVDILWTLASAP